MAYAWWDRPLGSATPYAGLSRQAKMDKRKKMRVLVRRDKDPQDGLLE